MRTKIYQINSERDTKHAKFEGLELLERYQSSAAVDSSIYDEVFNAEIDETDLEAIYQRFNTIGHPLHRGHSLSVSDVVVNDNGAFFCDSIGFRPIASLFKSGEPICLIHARKDAPRRGAASPGHPRGNPLAY